MFEIAGENRLGAARVNLKVILAGSLVGNGPPLKRPGIGRQALYLERFIP